MFQDKIKREKPPHDDAPVSFSPVADVLDSKRPVDPLAGNSARLSAAVEGNYIGFDRRPLFDQCLHETQRRHSLGIEVMTELRPRENSTVETNKRKPFRLPFLLRVILSSRHIYLSAFPAVDGWLSAPLLPQQF